jgi:hypothetical protein
MKIILALFLTSGLAFSKNCLLKLQTEEVGKWSNYRQHASCDGKKITLSLKEKEPTTEQSFLNALTELQSTITNSEKVKLLSCTTAVENTIRSDGSVLEKNTHLCMFAD